MSLLLAYLYFFYSLNTFISSLDTLSIIATLGPSWNFNQAENLESLSLQDGPQRKMGHNYWKDHNKKKWGLNK
jgi:hypothetical protein